MCVIIIIIIIIIIIYITVHVGTYCMRYTWRVHIFCIALGVPLTTPPPADVIGFMFANMACNVYVQGSVIIHPGMHMYSCTTLTSIAVNSIHTSLTNHVH